MKNKIVMIEEGDIGINFKMCEKDENFCLMLEEGIVEYKSKDECYKDFIDMLDIDRVGVEYVNEVKEKMKMLDSYDGRWFVGDNGEYIIIIGCEYV